MEPSLNVGRTRAKWAQVVALTVSICISAVIIHRYAKKQAEKELMLLKEEEEWEKKMQEEA